MAAHLGTHTSDNAVPVHVEAVRARRREADAFLQRLWANPEEVETPARASLDERKHHWQKAHELQLEEFACSLKTNLSYETRFQILAAAHHKTFHHETVFELRATAPEVSVQTGFEARTGANVRKHLEFELAALVSLAAEREHCS